MSDFYLLGCDVGTSGTKSVLFTLSGKPVASSVYEYPLYQPQNGYAEQDPRDFAEAAFASIRDVIAKSGVSPDSVLSVGLSGQMHGLVLLDEKGEPLRRAIIWCDQRTGEECEEITRILGREKLIAITANPAATCICARCDSETS